MRTLVVELLVTPPHPWYTRQYDSGELLSVWATVSILKKVKPHGGYHTYNIVCREPGLRNRYSDWLLPGRFTVRSSNPGSINNLFPSTVSTLARGSAQSPTQQVPRVLSARGNVADT
jgi:hypothetical protein